MNNAKLKSNSIEFEIVESDKNSAVFKRILPSRGRSPKENQLVEMSLPKATIHYFTYDDYINLKKIEEDLIKKFSSGKKTRTFLKKFEDFFG